jgi:hypothetical protein
MTVTGYRGNRIYINLYSRLAAAWAPALYVSIRCLVKWELKYTISDWVLLAPGMGFEPTRRVSANRYLQALAIATFGGHSMPVALPG